MMILQNLKVIRERIAVAAEKSGRQPEDIRLVAVSKKQPLAKLQEYCALLHSGSGLPLLGENYLQEFRDKKASLVQPFEAHLIGPLQSNKVRLAVSLFDLIETVDSIRIAALIDKEAARISKIQPVYLQVNISSDSAKAGFTPEELNRSLFSELKKFPNLKCEGLMTITRQYEDSELARPDFRQLKQISLDFQDFFDLSRVAVSMGMSDDFEIAIEEGATHVRIGTALFGRREMT